MTATCHVLHAGDGYTYLTRQVASGDHRRERGQNLADYYTAEGYPPGRWMGSGCAALDVSGTVEERQMRALFGEGLHPDADRLIADQQRTYAADLVDHGVAADQVGGELERVYPAFERTARLGRKYPVFDDSRAREWSEAIQEHLVSIAARDGVAVKDLDRNQRNEARFDAGLMLYAAEKGRPPEDVDDLKAYIARRSKPTPQAVAGYDMVFSPAKSVSVLWALGDDGTRQAIQDAHHAAVAKAMDFVEHESLFTRTGAAGVAQVDAQGLVATAFDHWDSRTGDPDLHTHVAIANKVQGPDGKWRSIDGRVLLKSVVSASETYNTAIEDELRTRLAVAFVDRTSRSGRRPVREIAGVDQQLLDGFSTRRRGIEQRYDELVAQYRAEHGHEPSRTIQYRLAQQATLDTRDAKGGPESLADKHQRWTNTAQSLIGRRRADRLLQECQGAIDVAREAAASKHDPRLGPPTLADGTVDVDRIAADTVQVVQHERSTWQGWHLRAEAHRQLRAVDIDPGEREQVLQTVVDRAIDGPCILVTPPVQEDLPADLQRSDGTSVFRVHGADLYTSQAVLDAEDRLLAAAQTPAYPPVDRSVLVDSLPQTEARRDKTLDPSQRRLVESFACGERLLVAGVGPAGAGKTLAMAALADACRSSGRRLLGFAPSAAAAKVLEEDTDAPADTLAKLLHTLLQTGDVDIREGDVLLVDESGMSATEDLDQLTRLAAERGAVVRLLGDPQQLSAVGAGGALRLLVNRTDAVELDALHRFTDPAEAAATLLLRDGNLSAIDFYSDAARIHSGSVASLQDRLYRDWLDDMEHGHSAVMVAADNNSARALAERARLDRVADGVVEADGVELHDGTKAGAGDIVVTRRNRRDLRLKRNDFVKNGDLWIVRHRHRDGRLTVAHRVTGAKTTLPAAYVDEHVELGYAFTGHRVQGLTVDIARALVDAATVGRDWLYVAMSRGRLSNHVYVATDEMLDVDVDHAPDRPLNPREALSRVLAREPEGLSAHEAIEHEQDASQTLSVLVPQYEHALELHSADHHRDDVVRAFSPPTEQQQSVPPPAEGAPETRPERPAAPARKPAGPARRVPAAPEISTEQRQRLIALNEAAYAYCMSYRGGSWVPGYLVGRELADVPAGYAPDGWTTMLDALAEQGFTGDEMVAAGLAKPSRYGQLYSVFRDRAVLPFRNADGEIVGFVGRAAEDAGEDVAKYLNTPETALFAKRELLIGLAEGADALRNGASAVLVEGPFDAYAVTLSCDGRAVGLAPSGTALTPEQIAALNDVVPLDQPTLTVATDNDTAGDRAARQDWHRLVDAGADPRRVFRADLGDVKDPAQLRQEQGPEAVRTAVAEPETLLVDTNLDAIAQQWRRHHPDNPLVYPQMLREMARSLTNIDRSAATEAFARFTQRFDVDPDLAVEVLVDVLSNSTATRPPTADRHGSGEPPPERSGEDRAAYAAAVLNDPTWPALAARLAAVEQAGHDPADVLRSVISERELDTAQSAAEVLSWRLDQAGYTPDTLGQAPPETIDPHNPLGGWLNARQDTIGQRRDHVTRLLLDEQPHWLVDTLGHPPADRDEAYWRAAEAIATYRDRYDVDDQFRPLGHRPSSTLQRQQYRAANLAVAAWRESLEPELDEPVAAERSRSERQILQARLDDLRERAGRRPVQPSVDDEDLDDRSPGHGRDDTGRER